MSKMNEDAYENKRALPNKMLNEDGSVTDLLGNPVVPTDEAYKKRPALPNKWLNADGTYSTLQEILGGAIDTDIFIVVEELPQTGEENKIYLVPDGEGGFNEYHYINGEWDPVGVIDMGVSPQVYYWDGNTQQAGLDFWNNIYQLQKTQPCLVYTRYTQNNKSITQHWLYNNDMPTSASETTVSYSVYTPSGMQMINNSYSQISRYTCQLYFTITDDQVTAISMNTHSPSSISYIDATGYYPTAFIPSSPSSPATKKYVDDKVVPQVFYWDGNTQQAGLDFWNNIYQLQKTQPCLVYTEYTQSGAKITQSWYYNNNLPTSIFDTNAVSRWLGDKATSNSRQSLVTVWNAGLYFSIENDTITSIHYINNGYREYTYLDTNEDYSQPYMPLYPGSPATKKYVDDKVFYLPISSSDTTTITWSNLYNAYNSNNIIIAKIDYLSNSISVPMIAPLYCIMGDQTGGTVLFTFVMGMEVIMYMVTGTGENVCTITKQENSLEILSDKVQSVISNNTSQDKYPSTKAVFDEFQRRPVIVWESDTPSEYLKAIQADLSASPTWQLTNLDLTAFKSIKIYSCAGQGTGSTASASTTPSIVLEMSLDSRAAIAAYGGNYVASVVVQKPNDANRLATLTCVVSADKTKFTVLRQTSLYGTAATSNNDVNANVFMIEGYYADGVTLPDGDNTQY